MKAVIAYHVTPERFDVFRTPAEFTDRAGAERLMENFPKENVIKVSLTLGKTQKLDMKKVDPDNKEKLKDYMLSNGIDSVLVPSNWGNRDDIIVLSTSQIRILKTGKKEI